MQMSKDLCLGKFCFQGALILRGALFLSSLISNSEAWVNLTEKNITELEAVDERLLRDILSPKNRKRAALSGNWIPSCEICDNV